MPESQSALESAPKRLALHLRRFAAAMSLCAGLAMCGLAVWTWFQLSPPMKSAIRATKHTVGTVRASAAQMARDLETLPQTLADAERASKSTAQALRAVNDALPGIFTQVEATAKTINDAGAGVGSVAGGIRKTADALGGWKEWLDAVKAARQSLNAAAGTLDLVAPQTAEIAKTITAISKSQRGPLQSSLRDSASASEASAAWLATIRTGVLPTVPRALTDLADSLDAVVGSLDTIPKVIDALVALGLAFGIGFLASGLQQFAQIFLLQTQTPK